jgi:hypothetical protein
MLLQKGQVIAQPCSLHTTSGKTPLTPEKPGEIEINPESEFQAASSNKKKRPCSRDQENETIQEQEKNRHASSDSDQKVVTKSPKTMTLQR